MFATTFKMFDNKKGYVLGERRPGRGRRRLEGREGRTKGTKREIIQIRQNVNNC